VLQGLRRQAVGFVEDEQVDVARRLGGEVGVVAADVLVDADVNACQRCSTGVLAPG